MEFPNKHDQLLKITLGRPCFKVAVPVALITYYRLGLENIGQENRFLSLGNWTFMYLQGREVSRHVFLKKKSSVFETDAT
jgi:hypothetical protein